MDTESQSIRGEVAEVGLRRDEDHFNSFNLTIGMVLKSDKALDYDRGERLMRQFRKEFLGKVVEITAIVFPCPVCGKGFNTEQGMKQHMRMIHEKKKKGKTKKPGETKARSSRRKSTKKRASKSRGKKIKSPL